MDKNGAVTYTEIVSVNMAGGKPFVQFYPNPVQNKTVNVQMNNLAAGKYNLTLYNNAGQKIFNQVIEHAGGGSTQRILLPQFTAAGTCIIRLYNEKVQYSSLLLIK